MRWVRTGDGLEAALVRRVGRGGRAVIRIRLPDRRANVTRHHEVNAAIVEAVDGRSG